VVTTPPQHAKTETGLHALAWFLQRDPTRRNAYVTYESDRAYKLSEKAQGFATAAGIEWSGTRKYWRTPEGGSVFATGVDSGFTGEPVDGILLVDDPIKDVVEANSATYRNRADEWLQGVALTRAHPSASVIVVQTRWHPDDLAGRLIGRGWEKIHLPAISDGHGNPAEDGVALWPSQRPIEFLKRQRAEISSFVWASLWQGQPRARGDAVFGDVHLYDPRSTTLHGRMMAMGVDCAYSEKTYSDYSVGLVLAKCGGLYYVLDVQRARIKAPVFKERLDGQKKTYSVTRSRWYTSTTESGTASLLGISPLITRSDKHTRAQKCAAAWNAGKILCPAGALWLNDFVSEVVTFTGINDSHDDQVDALVAAYDELESPMPSYAGLPQIHVPRRF